MKIVASVLMGLGLWLAPASAAPVGDDCTPPLSSNWTERHATHCIEVVTKKLDGARSVEERARLLDQRARLHESRSHMRDGAGGDPAPDRESALADYAAAIELAPGDARLRERRVDLLLLLERGDDALKDAEILLGLDRANPRNHMRRGQALALLKRHQEAVAAHTEAIRLAQSCAEASALQRRVNEFRRAFDPPPTRAQLEADAQRIHEGELYDVPSPAVIAIGFPCRASDAKALQDLVGWKPIFFSQRAISLHALGKSFDALRDLEYAHSMDASGLGLGATQLCALQVELGQGYDAGKTCRDAFSYNFWVLLDDADQAVRIGRFLLDDGEVKGACRIAFPFLSPPISRQMEAYLEAPAIKDLQQRVRRALGALGRTGCDEANPIPNTPINLRSNPHRPAYMRVRG
jgi:tetratricopeptide (TPR) repeat protein